MSLLLSDTSICEVVSFFTKFGIDVGLLVPTYTGLDKSILDANSAFRDFLSIYKIHDYEKQLQGTNNKVIIESKFVGLDCSQVSKTSLYRPETKSGDPRIWFSGLKQYANPNNLLVFFIGNKGDFYCVNASNKKLMESGNHQGSYFNSLLCKSIPEKSAIASDLLNLIKTISMKGYVKSLRSGPTGVGFTLETLLGISANSSKEPDFCGIEIKSGRVNSKGKPKSRSTLFSAVPDWSSSVINSATKILALHGYKKGNGRLQLYCTLDNKPNSLGFYLNVDNGEDVLHALKNSNNELNNIVQWGIPKLRVSLAQKHKETFWVKAMTQKNNGSEEFYFTEVEHTFSPFTVNLGSLFTEGIIQVDFTLSMKELSNGGSKTRDHGYLFKIWDYNRNLIFPPGKTYSLIG